MPISVSRHLALPQFPLATDFSQFRTALIKFAGTPIPFANRAKQSTDEFERAKIRWQEGASNLVDALLHGFSCAPSEVRKASTIERKIVLECAYKGFREIKI